MGMKTRRRISDRALADAKAAVRRVFRDAEEEALNALGNSGLEGDGAEGTEGMDDGAAGDDDNHIHVHLHQGGEGGGGNPPLAVTWLMTPSRRASKASSRATRRSWNISPP